MPDVMGVSRSILCIHAAKNLNVELRRLHMSAGPDRAAIADQTPSETDSLPWVRVVSITDEVWQQERRSGRLQGIWENLVADFMNAFL